MLIKYCSFLVICFLSFTSFTQQLERFVLENWNGSDWENRMQQLPSYDEQGRLIRKVTAHWNKALTNWEDKSKMEFVRDENGVVLSREEFNWKADQSIWEATLRMNYTINAQSKPSSVLTEVRGAEGWYNTKIDEYSYNSNGQLIEKRSEKWDRNLKAWIPFQRFVYTINSGLKEGYVIFYWDRKLGEWDPYKRAEYHYTEEKEVDHISFNTWIDGDWKFHSTRKYTRDLDGVLMNMDVESFNDLEQNYDKLSHVDYEMTDFGKISSSVSSKWNTDLSDWEKLQRTNYWYTEKGDAVEEWSDDPDQMQLFPNPAVEQITIRSIPSGKVLILDALGKVVVEIENDQTHLDLDISKWEMGTYTVQVDGSEIKTFVKQ